MVAISGRKVPVVTPGTGVSGSSRAASSRPRAAERARVSAASERLHQANQAAEFGASPCAALLRWLAVGGIVQDSQDVVKQVFYAGVDMFEIALRDG